MIMPGQPANTMAAPMNAPAAPSGAPMAAALGAPSGPPAMAAPPGAPVPNVAAALAALLAKAGAGAAPGAPAAPMAPPPPPPPRFHDVTIVSTRKLAVARVMGVPPEEFGIERAARTIRDCNYCFHDVVTKTEADLIAEGYDAEQVKGLTTYTGDSDIETIERDTVQEHMFSLSDNNPAARPVKITEHYVRLDYEGNGKVALYQVVTGGDQGEVLRRDGKPAVTPFDAIPFAAGTPIPITHRFFGRSMADVIMPTQREKTALKRGALDNLYLRNNPRVEVAKDFAGPNTLDDLLVSRPGGVVRVNKPGGVNWQEVPDVTGSLYPIIQYLDAELEARTGMSRQSQGIDANALQNQSATAVAQVFSASQMRVKLLARILAEGVRDIFSLLHATIRKHGQQSETVQLRNQWIDVDPRDWRSRNHMTIRVGLGTGSKAQQFAQTMAIGNVQKEMLSAGKINMVGDRELYNTAAELTRIMGHKNADAFFRDPSEVNPLTGQLANPLPPPKPDPQLAMLQARAQLDQATAGHQAQLDQQQAQLAATHQQIKAQADQQLVAFKAEIDARLRLLDAHLQAESAARDAHHAHQRDQHDMAQDMLRNAAQPQDVDPAPGAAQNSVQNSADGGGATQP